MVRTIFHLDLDSFFASVEEIYDPSLKGTAFAVGGRTKRSVVGSASYAARRMGVKAGMPIFQVEAISRTIRVVDHHFDRYTKYSELFFEELSRAFTDRIEAGSIDECFMDVTDLVTNEDPEVLATRIQRHIQRKLQLGVSIGISTNKFLAKVAGDMKKPLGITVLYPKDVKERLWPLPVKTMIYVGPSTALALNRLGIFTVGDLAMFTDVAALESAVGTVWHSLRLHAMGIGDDVVSMADNEAKSIGHSVTLPEDSSSYDEVARVIKDICDSIESRAVQGRQVGTRLSVKLRDAKFRDISKNATLTKPTNDRHELLVKSLAMLDSLWPDRPVRLVGVTLAGLVREDSVYEQLTIFNFADRQNNDAGRIAGLVNKQVNARAVWTADEVMKFQRKSKL